MGWISSVIYVFEQVKTHDRKSNCFRCGWIYLIKRSVIRKGTVHFYGTTCFGVANAEIILSCTRSRECLYLCPTALLEG